MLSPGAGEVTIKMRTTFVSWLLAATVGVAACGQPATSSQASQPADQSQPAAQTPPADQAQTPASLAAPAGAPAGSTPASAPAPPPPPPPPTFQEVTLPPETTIPVKLVSSLASNTSKVEDPVRAEVRKDVEYSGLVVIPAGTTLSGTVTDAERSGKVKGLARLAFRFSSLSLGDERYDLTASPITVTAQSTKKKDATKVGIGAGAGAVIGGIIGGGKGAAIGAGVGGGAGTGVVMASRGREVHLPAGTPITLTLNEPLTVRVPLGR